MTAVNHTEMMTLKDQFEYVIDNGSIKETQIGDVKLEVFNPKKVKTEKAGIIIITSSIYMLEMYKQLMDTNLPDSIIVYIFPFMQMVTKNKMDLNLLKKIKDEKSEVRIPKIIHSFWFSGDEKPQAYSKCIETWWEKLPDYKIIEWNMKNYEWEKHPFMRRCKKQVKTYILGVRT